MTAKQLLIGIATAICILLMAESANAQLFRNFSKARQVTYPTVWSQPRAVPPKSSLPQPVTGYSTNLHRNFVIRQEQQKYQKTGVPPRQRGNILWAR